MKFAPLPSTRQLFPDEALATPDVIGFRSPEDAKVLHAAIIGPPNAGKSVLCNRLVNATVGACRRGCRRPLSRTWQVSAASAKYHTTRTRMLGFMTEESTQIVFHDTPGFLEEGCALAARARPGPARS